MSNEMKPSTITAWEFVEGDYARLIHEKKCEVNWDWNNQEITSIANGTMYFKTSIGLECHMSDTFTVTWQPDTAPTVPAQPADASGAGDVVPRIPTYKDETWYGVGYNDGYEDAAKIAREQYALVDMWTNKIADVQAELATAKAEAARLREALEVSQIIEGRWVRLMELATEADTMRTKAMELSTETDRLYTILDNSGITDHRKKEWREWDSASKSSNMAWMNFNTMGLRNIGLTVLDMWRREQSAAALQPAAKTESEG